MMIHAEVGHWYRIEYSSDPVEVVSLDDDDQTVEIQHFNGEIEAIDVNDWLSLSPIEVQAPEDWSGPFEMERQDIEPNRLFLDYTRSDALATFEKP
jgi:hypothetical protein